ncbi:MAG: NAD(P)H-hydrate epimerase, partial [Candidatus Zixiibacteriota bacterium]
MYLVTAEQMKQIDRAAIEKHRIPSLELMENAGCGMAERLILQNIIDPAADCKVVIFCGKGNNGGDGFVVGRQLRMRGLSPRVVLLADPAAIRGDARVNYDALLKTGGAPAVVCNPAQWRALRTELA